MADIKREIRTLGQRMSGLTAGNKYTFVLKRPNVRVDVVNAEKSLALAESQIGAIRKLLVELEQARNNAMRADASAAQGKLDAAGTAARDIAKAVSDAKEFACAPPRMPKTRMPMSRMPMARPRTGQSKRCGSPKT